MTIVFRTIRAAVFLSLAFATAADTKPGAADEFQLRSFDRKQLTDTYFSEGANAGDLNRDGHSDVVYGPYWFEGPSFEKKHEIYASKPQPTERYADNFFNWIYDFNGDGLNDVFVVGFPATPAYVYENPGDKPGHWPKHKVFDAVANESPQLTNIVGDERPELVCTFGGSFGYATIDWQKPFEKWKFHAVSDATAPKQFGHGLGVGDVNGDGRLDILSASGWFEQPAKDADTARWQFHEAKFTNAYGGAEMYAYDVDGDGDSDVITSLAAHDYGLAWYEQVRDGHDVTFREQIIMGDRPEQNRYGLVFTEPHSVALADMDGDGLKDIITGKTYYSHHKQSPMWDAGAVVYWFRLVRGKDGVDWVPYKADGEAGIGRQISIVDVNADKVPDIVVGGMKGAHVLTQSRKKVTESEWNSAQPQPLAARPKVRIQDNLGFEAGNLDGWTAEGPAFSGQPVRGDRVAARRSDMQSQHGGEYWIGTYEVGADGPTGTLKSDPFTVTHPWATFLIGGGGLDETRVELYLPDTQQVIFQANGKNTENMHKVVVDLRRHQGKKIVIRVVDEHKGGWGHINFDDFQFHSEQPGEVTQSFVRLTQDEYPHAGLAAEDAAKAMKVPDGFTVTAFAAEPDVQQPIAMALDDRGRVWIAEAFEYPQRAKGEKGRDRILIFEDNNGDGRFDKRTVFAEGLNLVSGLEVGFGGVWVGAAPYLMFIPDKDGDDKPDGEPQILLDGWGYQDTHETLNAFIWGPDGWLYGCHGVFTHSNVGKPGATDKERQRINAGIWRYHPTRHEFEVFAEGTSNPWGVDFNDYGQAFITACVIPHLYHIIPGARYERQAGSHFNPYTYNDIKTIADHLHYLGATPHGGNSKSDAAGGGHAHAGAMIYLGGAWPERYRNQLFMNNIHGQRLNMDTLKPRGSGYVGSHGPDFLLTGDQASQILNLRYGPDGQAYMIDWYDMQACHLRESEKHDRTNGRIYKITYGAPKPVTVDLKSKSDLELAENLLNKNDWYVRHSRRILQERAAVGKVDEAAIKFLTETCRTHRNDTRRLRALWVLHVIGAANADVTSQLLADATPYVRAWAIQSAIERGETPAAELYATFATLAEKDDSPVVRLAVASALQRLPHGEPEQSTAKLNVLAKLSSHSEDASDHNLPLMYWYALEPVVEGNPEAALQLALSTSNTIPILRDYVVRRIASLDSPDALAALVSGLKQVQEADVQRSFLSAVRSALKGRRKVDAPEGWDVTYAALSKSNDVDVQLEAAALGAIFGTKQSSELLQQLANDGKQQQARRRQAIESLLAVRDQSIVPSLREWLKDDAVRDLALRGVAQFDDAETGRAVLQAYPKLAADEKRVALAALSSRASYATELLRAVGEKQIAPSDLSADVIRQLQNLKNADVNKLVEQYWGNVRETAADKAKLVAEYTKLMTAKNQPQVDHSLGRAIFAKTCQQCHILYGVGSKIGPDLTGSNRANLEYLLSNVVDPSAVMAKEYQPSVIVTTDGRVVTGLVRSEDDKSITLQTATETVVLPKNEVEERELSQKSMMPDDQLKQFSEHQVRSLLAYVGGKNQVPMQLTKDTSPMFFNGRDLTGWTGNTELWSVEDGEIVGRTTGLKQNEFLVSDVSADDFKLTLEVKLVGNAGNSGIQFRSEVLPDGDIRGYQADIGVGWWGKLYEEHGRALLWDKSGEAHVRKGEWNTYTIEAQGSRIRTWINGELCVDLDDAEGAKRGIFALQLHSGGATEVRFRNLELIPTGDGAEAAQAAAGQ